MSFEKELDMRVKAANLAVEEWLPKEKKMPGELKDAMKYSVLAGGKRIRPVLMAECYKLFGGMGGEIRLFQAAVEFIHTSSLVHDDLPALDNDMFRRGKKTTHAYFGEALGVLAGDALLNYAYEVLIDGVISTPNKENATRAARILAVKSGYRGMLGGQDVDVEVEKKGIKGDRLEILDYIYEKKTGALIEASMMVGAALAGASEDKISLLEKIGRKIGLAFQIQDDVLDITGTTRSMGKSVFSDVKNNRETYITVIGVEAASDKVRELTKDAVNMVDQLPGDTGFLKEMLSYLALRKK